MSNKRIIVSMPDISHADIADAAEILELQKLAFQSQAILYDYWSMPPLTQTLEDIREEFGRLVFLKATESGRIIGSVRASLDDGTCHIGRLIVHPDFQNQGIGTRLMRAIEAEFPDAQRYELFTGSRSERNIHLYEKLGYRIIRQEPVSNNVSLLYMVKALS